MENIFNTKEIEIYTDGSCHTQTKTGAWVAILLYAGQKIILQGTETNTTHNRMELMGIINAVKYIAVHIKGDFVLQIFTDSQYAMNLPLRFGKLMAANFVTKKGKELPNTDLLKILGNLLASQATHFNKIRAHQKENSTVNYNIVADKLARSLVRGME